MAAKFEVTSKLNDVTYRIVYLRPNPYSEEALAIGVILRAGREMYTRFIASEATYNAIAHLFGENGREQVSLAIDLLRNYLANRDPDLDSVDLPSDILCLGNSKSGVCDDPERFTFDLLEISSSLFRSYSSPPIDSWYITQERISYSLLETVTHMNALKATSLFKGLSVPLSSQSAIKVPISGEKVIGGPVSLVTKQVGAAKTQAEALIAKYSIAGRIVKKQAALYLLIPEFDSKINQREVESSLSELRAIADGHQVLIRHERKLPELARALLQDEVA